MSKILFEHNIAYQKALTPVLVKAHCNLRDITTLVIDSVEYKGADLSFIINEIHTPILAVDIWDEAATVARGMAREAGIHMKNNYQW